MAWAVEQYIIGNNPNETTPLSYRRPWLKPKPYLSTPKNTSAGLSPQRAKVPLNRAPYPANPQLSELLQQWRREDGHRADSIIHYKGRSVKSIKTGFACTKLESCLTRRIRPYNFRHAPITTMLLGGKDIQTVSALA